MKRIFIILNSVILLTFVCKSQNIVQTVIVGDTVELSLTEDIGSILWQQSNDSLEWTDIQNAITSPYYVVTEISPTNNRFYRAKIVRCVLETPFYSDVIKLKIINSSSELQIGELFHGGKVFYTDGAGLGLIAPLDDQTAWNDGSSIWGCYGISIPSAQSMTDGFSNTEAIISNCTMPTTMAKVCYDLEINNYNDWFLPAINELDYLFQNKDIIGGFEDQNGRMSSTEVDENYALAHTFEAGYHYQDTKTSQIEFRCIRAFNETDYENGKTLSIVSVTPPHVVYEDEAICIVSVDTTFWKNKIVWNKTSNVGTVSYNVYKESGLNEYTYLGNVDFNESPEYIDFDSQPESHGDKYKITAKDTCGNESEMSPFHKTMNLTVAVNGTTMGLNWDDYIDEGGDFIPSKFYIFRGTTSKNIALYDSISASFHSYNDFDVTDMYYYMVAVKKENGCNTEKNKQSSFSFSNKKINFNTEITEINIQDVNIFPNPAKNSITIKGLQNGHLEIINIQGLNLKTIEIINDEINIDISTIPNGIYTLKVKINDEIITRKFVKK